MIAHRGASAERPENTFAAFDEALRQGCDAIELDLQLTRDGVPVVYHDRTLTKLGGGRRSVRTTTLRALQQLDAGGWFAARFRGETVPTLEAVLQRYADRTRLLLEIKLRGPRPWQERLVSEVVTSLGRLRVLHRVFLLCFEADLLRLGREIEPGLRCVLNVRPRRWRMRRLRGSLSGLHALSADVRGVTPALGHLVARAGLPLFTFTCNTPRQVARSLAAGASGLISDRPGWLVRQLERAGAAPPPGREGRAP